MKNITFDDVKKMWMDSPEKESVVGFYCYKNGLECNKVSEEEKAKIYSDLYPISSFIRDYYKDMFLYGGCEPDYEVREIYEQILMDEFI